MAVRGAPAIAIAACLAAARWIHLESTSITLLLQTTNWTIY